MADFLIRMIAHSVMAVAPARRTGCPIKHPSPKKSPVPRMATRASFPCFSEVTRILMGRSMMIA